MINLQLNTDGFTGHILIEPNHPISWADNIRFIKVFTVVSLLIGAYFTYNGYLLVLPFSGLEVLVVALSLYLVFRRYDICQVIYFTTDEVVIESGKSHADQRIEYQRFWSKFHVDNEGRYNIPRLTICSKGQTTEIGEFLNYEDKAKLIDIIKELTTKFQSQAKQ